MRKLLRKIIEILDGTPAVYGKKQRGQSTLELALVSPIIVILLAGMVEIGWFARNYLILLEVTRVGARLGAVQQNQTDPNNWDNLGSIRSEAYPVGGDFCADFAQTGETCPADSGTISERWAASYRSCAFGDGQPGREGFFNLITCNMLRSVDPLIFGQQLREDAGQDPLVVYPDDIVVSAFAIQAIDPDDIPPARLSDAQLPLPNDGNPQAVVVGRYPTNANECHEIAERDPFDWIQNDTWDPNTTGAAKAAGDRNERDYLELEGIDSTSERQRGFSWFAVHRIEGTNCFGSDWSTRDVEDLMNLQQFNLTADGRREYLPSQGMVLTEMWWQHEPISQFLGLSPVISPVFGMLGTDTIIEAWAAFPLPQVEPKLVIN